MFRIKTDIRQYECESREKVERLIRNWVVRPTDLIFYEEREEWGPIGEHEEFMSTFAELSEGEAEAPDTIVSTESPPANEHLSESEGTSEEGSDASPGEALEPPEPPEGVEPHDAEPDEVTVMTEETLEDYLQEEGPRGEADHLPSRPDGAERTGPSGEPSVDDAAKAAAEAGAPESIEGVQTEPEDLGGDKGENGVLGEQRVDSSEDAVEEEPPIAATVGDESTVPEVPGATAPDEPTEPGAEPPEELMESAPTPPDEPTEPDAEAPAELMESPAEAPGESADPEQHERRDTDEIEGDGGADGDDLQEEASAVESNALGAKLEISGDVRTRGGDSNVGRHDLPEEVFVTNEIDADEIGIDSGEEDGTDSPGTADGGEAAKSRRVEDALQQNAKSVRRDDVEDQWDAILERLRETDELTKEEIEQITETQGDVPFRRDEGGESTGSLDAKWEFAESEEYGSEAYDSELPISVEPSRRDVRVGLIPSDASERDKERVFPKPSPKRRGEPVRRTYVLRPPIARTLRIALLIVGAFVAILVGAVFLL